MRLQLVSTPTPPSDVFRFVATGHFADHLRWDPSVLRSGGPSPSWSTNRYPFRRHRRPRILPAEAGGALLPDMRGGPTWSW